MTTTITPEERAHWRKFCMEKAQKDADIGCPPNPDNVVILRLLDALGEMEAQRDFLAGASQPLADLYQDALARAEKAEEERDVLISHMIDIGSDAPCETYGCPWGNRECHKGGMPLYKPRCWREWAAQEAARRASPALDNASCISKTSGSETQEGTA